MMTLDDPSPFFDSLQFFVRHNYVRTLPLGGWGRRGGRLSYVTDERLYESREKLKAIFVLLHTQINKKIYTDTHFVSALFFALFVPVPVRVIDMMG